MRIIRKALLALSAVSLVSLVGFASSVFAVTLNVTVDSNNNVEWSFPNDDNDYAIHSAEDEHDRDGILQVMVNGKEIERYDSEENNINLTDLIYEKLNDGSISGSAYDGQVTIKIDKVDVEKYDESSGDYVTTVESASGSAGPIAGIYKQIVTKKGEGRVRAKVGMDTYTSEDDKSVEFYAVAGEEVYLIAEETGGGQFTKWSDGGAKEHTYTVRNSSTYTAEFSKPATGVTLKVNNKTTAKQTIYNDGSITLAVDITPKGNAYKSVKFYPESSEFFTKKSDTVWQARKNTTSPVKIYAVVELYGGLSPLTSNTIEVSITDKSYNPSQFRIKADEDYVTDGYAVDLIPEFSTMGSVYDAIVWSVEGEGVLTGLNPFTGSGKTVKDMMGVELYAIEGKVESGKTGTLKVTATLPNGNGQGVDLVETKEITVYPRNTIKYNDSDKNLSFTSPSKVSTGKTSGVDNDNKDVTKTSISDVKGIKIHVYSGDNFLGMTSVAKDKGTSGTIDSATLGKITGSVSASLSGESADLKIRALPCDSDGKYNKKVYANTTVTVYRVVVTYTKADGTTADYITYRPEGQKLNVADAIAEVVSASDGKVTEVDGVTDTTITVSSSAAKNKHTAVLGASRTAASAGASGGSGAANRDTNDPALDKVPKTGQDNTFVLIMAAVVACAVGGGLYAYNKKFKKA